MRSIGNFLWFILGGFFMGLGWWLVGLIAFVSIVGIPWGRACFVIGNFTFFPFGREAISRKELTHEEDKLAGIALAPVGKTIVSKAVAAAAREANARAQVSQMRRD